MYLFINYQFLLKDGLHKRLDSLYKLVPSKKKTYLYNYTETQAKPNAKQQKRYSYKETKLLITKKKLLKLMYV